MERSLDPWCLMPLDFKDTHVPGLVIDLSNLSFANCKGRIKYLCLKLLWCGHKGLSPQLVGSQSMLHEESCLFLSAEHQTQCLAHRGGY